MKKICMIIILLIGLSNAGEWETFTLRDNGSIPVWTVAGSFPNGMPGFHDHGCFGYFKDYLISLGGEAKAIPVENTITKLENGTEIEWKTAFSKPSGLLDFIDILKVETKAPGVAYAFCKLIAAKDQTVIINIRSNDGVKAWLNGESIHDHHVGRTIDAEEDRVKVEIKKGENPILFKIDQGGGKWGLSVSLVNEDGKAVKDIKCSINNSTRISNKIYKADVSTTQLIKKTIQGEKQIINVNVFSGGMQNVKISIHKNEWEEPQTKVIDLLPIGNQIIPLEVPVIKTTESAEIQIASSSDKLVLSDVVLPKVNKWRLYFVQHVHTDIGYTRPQTEILPEHLRFIDYALDFCDLTDDYPDDAKFRWTCEVTWPVREYLKRRPSEQIERLLQRVREGRIEIAGMFLNMSELATETSLAASLQPIREIKKYGIPVKTVLQNDVNGIGWCLVDYFHDIGIKYVNMGINKTRSVLPFDKPTSFWWESPSGKRVLAYRADHYHVGNYWKIHDGNTTAFEQGILEYLSSLEEIEYPYNQISVQYSGYNTDNSPPSTSACDLVKNWNEKYSWPKLRIATAHEFFEEIEKRYSDQLPVYRVAWPDWWTDGFGSAARETAEARKTQNNLQVSQGLLSMASLLGADIGPETNQRASTIQDALLFYQEHTFGSSESITDPESENSMIQWGEKSSYVWEAVKYEGLLREEAMGLLQPFVKRGKTPTIVVVNTLNWLRSGLVNLFIDHEILPLKSGYHIIDTITGDEVPMQPEKTRSEGTYWSIWIDDVPSMGFRTLSIVPEKKEQISQHWLIHLRNMKWKIAGTN